MDRSAFERERELYTESQLRTMMPATLAINDNASGAASTPYDYTFPPFVIIEHGQSLDEWARRNNADCIKIFQAAPEVVPAVEAGRKTISVDSALDIWAIGVIAFQLLTGEHAFNDAGLGPEDAEWGIRDAIVGRTSLPWEGPESGPHLQKLRGLKRTLLKSLERDPARRPSAEA